MTNLRRDYVPPEEILEEIREALSAHPPGSVDWITFVGSGEPTLHLRLGEILRQVKTLSQLPVAVITNGSLLYLPEVRQDLLPADAVLPSLDAGTPVLHRRINRHHRQVSFDRLVEGLVAFRQEYAGKIWVEVMLVDGMNDTEAALRDLAAVLRSIRPDQVHLVLPTRPPAEAWVRPASEEGLLRARAILGDLAQVVPPATRDLDLSGCDSVLDAIVAIVRRHPMSKDEIEAAVKRHFPEDADVADALAQLETSGRVQVVDRYGVQFWNAAPAHFAAPGPRGSPGAETPATRPPPAAE
jgi:wyosine [tRNA(Phe)-imidazoG37] synthetase (radical SAM superfamily)